jgi:hypothetical protein
MYMKMKEMIYSGNGKTEVLYLEESGDYGIAVVNTHGSHPCAYIKFPGIDDLESYDDIWIGDDEDYCDPHGGFTFLGNLDNIGLKGRWLGWDYAHLGDWHQGMPPEIDAFDHRDDKKYTTEEVAADARAALMFIEQGRYTIDDGM